MVKTLKRITRLAWVFVVLGVGSILLLTPIRARAHAGYERSDPPADAVIPEAPEEVHIWFTQELFRRQGENWIRVLGPDGAEVQLGESVIDDDDRAHMWVGLQPGLGPGEYLVQWRSLSAEDGDSEEGEFAFVVDPNAPPATSPPTTSSLGPPPVTEGSTTAQVASPTAGTAPTATAQPSSGLPCMGSILLGLGAIALRLRRR